MNDIIINRNEKINKHKLDINQYTISLLKQSYAAGLVDEGTINRFQMQTQDILKDLILQYTNGESSSVRVETAERILISILYCIDAYTAVFKNPEDALEFIKKEDFKKIYFKGYKYVKQCIQDCRIKYKNMLEKKLDIPLFTYNDTLDSGLSNFFKVYDIKFNAHDTMTSIDYPLVFDDMNIRGVFYIRNYLNNIDIENYFCSFFSTLEIKEIIKFYSQFHGINPKDLYSNVFEIVVNNSIFSVLSGKSAKNLIISDSQYSYLCKRFKYLQPNELDKAVEIAIYKILEDLSCTSIEVKLYLKRYKKLLVQRILNAVECENFKYLIIKNCDKENNHNNIKFKEGNSMDDKSFRSMINSVFEASALSNKINIIRSNVKSLGDFIDVLNSECLFQDEYLALYSDMEDLEIAMLIKIVLRDEFESGRIECIDILTSFEEMYIDSVWKEYLFEFIHSLDDNNLKHIERIINDKFI